MDFKKRVETCFKGNDIRCLYKKELDEDFAYKTGKAIVDYFKCKTIIVANDIRFSSPVLKQALIQGITEQGCNVIDIGMIDTPGLYFATGFLNLPGVSITASHNPIEYNGIKIVREMAVPVGMDSGLEKIKEIMLENKFQISKRKGKIIEKNILDDYKEYVLSFIDPKKLKPIKVVIDAGNSIAGKIVPLVYDNLPINLIKMYFEITGYFEHHEANPLKEENVKDLKERVVKEKADLGVAFDGDMDRVFFIDEEGKMIESSFVALAIIDYFYDEVKKSGFVYNTMMSRIIEDFAKEKKLKAIREKVGHSYIKNRMKKENAFFACEHSGHFFYKDNFYADSGIITSLIILEIYSEAKKKKRKFSELFKKYEKYSKLNEKSFKIKDKENAYEKIMNHFKEKAKKIDEFDGLGFDFGDFWIHIRFSQTEPLLRLSLEAVNEKVMKEKYDEVRKFLEGL